MTTRKFYRNNVVVTVYSEDEPLTFDDLSDLHDQMWQGPVVGTWETDSTEITPKEAVSGLWEVGSDPSFFCLDYEGNDCDD